jgi:hypothetical protein
MSLALELLLIPTAGCPEAPAADQEGPRLIISVIFTTVESTLAALRKASALANRLSARITLVVPQVVPYPLPMDSPPIRQEWNERRLRVIASDRPVETTVRIYLCRDPFDALMTVLSPRSVVVLAGSKRWWWPVPEKRLARKLRRAGHEVIYMEI